MLSETVRSIEGKCNQFLDDEQVRFVGIINKFGNLIAGGFKDGIDPFETDSKRRMLYMQMVLEIAMRKEFDSSLGPVNYIASNRGMALMISLPLNDHLLLISASPHASTEKLVTKALSIFEKVRKEEKL